MFLAFSHQSIAPLLQHNLASPDNMDQTELRPVYILQVTKSVHFSYLKKKIVKTQLT